MAEDAFLFDMEEFTEWQKEWQNMPEFLQGDLTPARSITVHFNCLEDVKEFAELVEQNVTPLTKSVWFPAEDRVKPSSLVWSDES